MNPTIWSPQGSNQSKLPAKTPHVLKTIADTAVGGSAAPYIGILTTNEKFGYLRVYLLAAKRMHSQAFVFKPQDIDWKKETVLGWTLVENTSEESWVCEEFPLPSVVYNRITNRSSEALPIVVAAKKEFSRRGIPMFNKSFFNKIQVFRLLSDSAVTGLLPETKPFDSCRVLQEMSRKFPILYIKPSGGSLGIGIIRIEKKPDGYRLLYRLNNRNHVWNYRRMSELYNHVKKICANKYYIIQQGINLRQVFGSPTDFRVHLHKNAAGRWECTAIGGKVAGNGSITTHVHSGGKIMDPEDILLFWENSMAYVKLEENAILVAEELEKKSGEVFGELGMDMGVDTEDNIWLFEVNSKPGRAIFKHPSLQIKGIQSAARVIEFSRFLANIPVGESRRG